MADGHGGAVALLLLLATLVLAPVLAVVLPSLLGETMLGIDLGTTFSVAATCHRGQATVVPVDGDLTTPSVVFFDPQVTGRVVVGRNAANQRVGYPANAVFDSKRVMGRNLTWDALAKEEAAMLPYDVVDAGDGAVAFNIPGRHRNGSAELLSPQQVASFVLRHLKHAAESSNFWAGVMGRRFTSVTVSVPVAFTDAQRAATVRAAEAAGFRMVRILEEPVAAAIAFGLHKGSRERLAIVYDMGGGTLDVALLRLELRTRTFLVLAAAGDPHLGGEDFDRALAKHLESTILPPDAGGASDAALLQAVERAKRQLSEQDTAPLDLPGGGEAVVSRELLEMVCEDLLARALQPVYGVLRDAGVHPDDVDDVVMVGGSSRLVAVQQRLDAFFPGRLRNHDVNPDTAIAVGAALSFGC